MKEAAIHQLLQFSSLCGGGEGLRLWRPQRHGVAVPTSQQVEHIPVLPGFWAPEEFIWFPMHPLVYQIVLGCLNGRKVACAGDGNWA